MIFYTHDIPLEITDKKLSAAEEENKIIVGGADAMQVFKHYHLIREGFIKGKPSFLFYVNDYEQVVKEIRKKFIIIEAAGGWVIKMEHGIKKALFMKRLGKWDLPKGKLEVGEKTDVAALREVEEECGVKAKIISPLCETWHTYEQRGKEILKCTHWFVMECLDDSKLAPQKEEGIDSVAWLTNEDIEKKVLPDTYSSIREVYKNLQKRGDW
jgi:8-oxo-dGTP pyrophosphatase MutT (NUDIX family)